MQFLHPELRKGLAEEHAQRLAEDRRAPSANGTEPRLVARLLLRAPKRLTDEQVRPDHASSASLTSRSASSLCSRRTAV
jgi:hypothetical protein